MNSSLHYNCISRHVLEPPAISCWLPAISFTLKASSRVLAQSLRIGGSLQYAYRHNAASNTLQTQSTQLVACSNAITMTLNAVLACFTPILETHLCIVALVSIVTHYAYIRFYVWRTAYETSPLLQHFLLVLYFYGCTSSR